MSAITDDWFAIACRENTRREEALHASTLSKYWSNHASRASDGVARTELDELIAIRDAVRGVLRAHGLPSNCRIELANVGQMGVGAAGFEDLPKSFDKPFILLDRAPYAACERTDVLNVYCGIALHEAGHILYSRKIYRRSFRGMSSRRRLYENLWEDERIENLVCIESPGFTPYIQAAKRHVLEMGEPGRELQKWDELAADLLRINALIFAFVRLPHLITPAIQQWRTIDGECIFETLRTLFPNPPQDESDIAIFASRLEALYNRLESRYASLTPQNLSSRHHGSLVDDYMKRAVDQMKADAFDRARNRAFVAWEPQKTLSEQLLDEAIQIEKAAHEKNISSQLSDLCNQAAQELVQRAIEIEQSPPGSIKRSEMVGTLNPDSLLNRLTSIQQTLSEDESEELSQRSDADREQVDQWKWLGENRITELVTRRPDQDARARYAMARCAVAKHISVLRKLFSYRTVVRNTIRRDLTSGQPDPRRLAKATVTERVFRRKTQHPTTGLAIALLLDESGSMADGKPVHKSDVALQIAVLMAEALKGVPGIELEVFSHTSSEGNECNCSVRYLFGKGNPNREAIGCYGISEMGANYDSEAILTVGKIFRQTTSHRNRWLIVLSDGLPFGRGYQGNSAIKASAEAVAKVRSQGIQVINVAIEDFKSEAIYGKPYVLKYTDLNELVMNIRKFLVRLFRASF